MTITGPSPENNLRQLKQKRSIMSNYPLYDVPYLVRESNWCWMSKTRQEIEKRNQAIVDDYFIARDQGGSAYAARKQVAQKHEIGRRRVDYCLRWYYQEAVRRKKYGFLQKFPPEEEHIVHFELIFALEFRKTQTKGGRL